MSWRWLQPDDPAWDGALAALEHDVYHLAGWTTTEAGLLEGEPRAFLFQQQDDVFFLPLVLRDIPGTELVDATSTFGYPGPLTTISEPGELEIAVDGLASALREAGAVSLIARLHPLLGPGTEALARLGRVVQHGETVAIDLRQSEEEIWREVKRDHRQDINRARRGGMNARIDEDWARFEEFLAIYQATMDRVDASGTYYFPREYFQELRERLTGRLQLWIVESEGDVAAAGLFTQVDGIVQFHLSGTADAHLRLSPSKLMIDQVWRTAREAGMRVFHLGGGVGASDDSLFTFKSRFSSWRLPFHTWRVIVQPEPYEQLAAERSPGDVDDDYFPAYRRTAAPG